MKNTIGHWNTRPATKMGSWSLWLAIVFVGMFAVNIPVNLYWIQNRAGSPPTFYVLVILLMLACGITGCICGVLAILKHAERSLLVWISTLIGLFALLLFLNEMMQGVRYLLAA